MFWLSYECFSILHDAFLLESVFLAITVMVSRSTQPQDLCWRVSAPSDLGKEPQLQKEGKLMLDLLSVNNDLEEKN